MAQDPIILDAVDFLKKLEGFEEKVYKDSAGILTIGYGFTKSIKEAREFINKGVISREQADSLLYGICEELAMDILDYDTYNDSTYNFAENELIALISLVYNIGISAYNSSTLKKLVVAKNKDYSLIYKEFLKWNKITVSGKKQELKGLTNRRKAEAELFCLKK